MRKFILTALLAYSPLASAGVYLVTGYGGATLPIDSLQAKLEGKQLSILGTPAQLSVNGFTSKNTSFYNTIGLGYQLNNYLSVEYLSTDYGRYFADASGTVIAKQSIRIPVTAHAEGTISSNVFRILPQYNLSSKYSTYAVLGYGKYHINSYYTVSIPVNNYSISSYKEEQENGTIIYGGVGLTRYFGDKAISLEVSFPLPLSIGLKMNWSF